MSEPQRKCPYCGAPLTSLPYWKHIQEQHTKEYETDRGTWIQLYKDYASMGMDKSICLQVVADLFNQPLDIVEEFLKENGAL